MDEIHRIPLYNSIKRYTDPDFKEGYNLKRNSTHSSLGSQLSNLMNQIRDAHNLLPRIKVGIPKPTQRFVNAKVAKIRQNIKKTFIEDSRGELSNEKKAMGKLLIWDSSSFGLAPHLG